MSSMSILSQLIFIRIRYHKFIEFAHAFHTMAILRYIAWLAWTHTILCFFYDLHVTINFYGLCMTLMFS